MVARNHYLENVMPRRRPQVPALPPLHARMAHPAPARCSVEIPGGFTTRVWTLADVKAYRAIGGWFQRGGRHDFDCTATARAASGEKEIA